MKATVEISATTGGSLQGHVTESPSFSGYIFLRKPEDLRVILLVPVLRNQAMDMVSDGKTWKLQYVLTTGLIGSVDNLTGSAGPWPTVTTVGLRGLTGRVNGDGTVTLWATTSTSSASGDNGADPNKVVEIVDQIAATQLSQAGNESFKTVVGPFYGTVFRGVGFVE